MQSALLISKVGSYIYSQCHQYLGTLLSNVVVDPPVHSWYPTQDYVVQKNNKTADTLFMFNCSVVLDTKAAIAGDRPEIYWRSNNEQIKDQKITTENDYGVKVSCKF